MNTKEIRKRRAEIPSPIVDAAANAWEQGHVIQLQRVPGAGEHHKAIETEKPGEIGADQGWKN